MMLFDDLIETDEGHSFIMMISNIVTYNKATDYTRQTHQCQNLGLTWILCNYLQEGKPFESSELN